MERAGRNAVDLLMSRIAKWALVAVSAQFIDSKIAMCSEDDLWPFYRCKRVLNFRGDVPVGSAQDDNRGLFESRFQILHTHVDDLLGRPNGEMQFRITRREFVCG